MRRVNFYKQIQKLINFQSHIFSQLNYGLPDFG